MATLHDIDRLDGQTAACARAEGGLRLRLGQVLEALSRGAYLELGFSSMSAYARERCQRSVRWVESARCLARRLEVLPALRRAVASAEVSWSMGELLARVATPLDEARWLALAGRHTVRQMRALVMDAAPGDGFDQELSLEIEAGEMCRLTCTVDHEEAWVFEATRTLLEHLGMRGSEEQIEALLAEGQDTLLAVLPPGALDGDRWQSSDALRERWREVLGRWRAEAERASEASISVSPARNGNGRGSAGGSSPEAEAGAAAAAGMLSLERSTPHELDTAVTALSRALSRHELELSQLIMSFHAVDGWRRMGYASEAQYARERLGMSRSSLLARRALGARLAALPQLASAMEAGLLGVQAALQLVRIATAGTEAAWVERARHRTVKHLEEEVTAALVAVRLSGIVECLPPADGELAAFQELERAVVSGRACRGESGCTEPSSESGSRAGTAATMDVDDSVASARRTWRVMLSSLAAWLESGFQMSAAPEGTPTSRRQASLGRVELRLWVTRATYIWWRELRAQAQAWLPPGMSWLRFLCLSVWRAWRHLLGGDVAYGQIYIRDRWRCTSPVCNRRDVTPHHLKLRSAGGSDEDDNVATVCTWCHLFGIHGGRIRATGTAKLIHWEIGAPEPCVIVHGRERVVVRTAPTG